MQRINRPAHAPLGAIFFVVVSLAIIPVSLRVAGVGSLSPRLAAAIDAAQQVTQIFGTGYGAEVNPEQRPAENTAPEDAGPSRHSDCASRELVYAPEEADAFSKTLEGAARHTRSGCRRAAQVSAPSPSIELHVSASAASTAADDTERALEHAASMKMDAFVLSDIMQMAASQNPWLRIGPTYASRKLALPPNLRFVIHIDQCKPGKPAESKVRAAISRAYRLERDRARFSAPLAIPDDAEL